MKTRVIKFMLSGLAVVLSLGCRSAAPAITGAPEFVDWEKTRQRFANAWPKRVGSVENNGLELPRCSPDGRWLAYLHIEGPPPPPQIRLAGPRSTPAEGSLQLWLKPVAGDDPGRRMSEERWVHSAAWSPDGQSLVYVVNDPDGASRLVLHPIAGQPTSIGVAGRRNCIPSFAPDGKSILFCVSPVEEARFELHRADLPGGRPASLGDRPIFGQHPRMTPDGQAVYYFEAGQSGLQLWRHRVRGGGGDLLLDGCGPPDPLASFHALECVVDPMNSDGSFCLFDATAGRIVGVSSDGRSSRGHRENTVAACWIEPSLFVLATEQDLFLTSAASGLSHTLLNGSWLPVRYRPADQTLILLGRATNERFAVWQLVFGKSPVD